MYPSNVSRISDLITAHPLPVLSKGFFYFIPCSNIFWGMPKGDWLQYRVLQKWCIGYHMPLNMSCIMCLPVVYQIHVGEQLRCLWDQVCYVSSSKAFWEKSAWLGGKQQRKHVHWLIRKTWKVILLSPPSDKTGCKFIGILRKHTGRGTSVVQQTPSAASHTAPENIPSYLVSV